MDGIKEVTAIWKHAADLGPILGPIVGGARTLAATLRTGLALSKMKGTGFFGGGHTGNNGLFNDNQGRKVVGAVHANEWVSPEWMTQHPDYAPIISSLETVRKRGYVEGGSLTWSFGKYRTGWRRRFWKYRAINQIQYGANGKSNYQKTILCDLRANSRCD
jgi:hypothetical protein